MKTNPQKQPNKITYDAQGKPLGRAASDVAKILIGKDNVNYSPNKIEKSMVEVKNIEGLIFTGKKLTQKKYYTHSGYLGNLKEFTLEEKLSKGPEKLFVKTVSGMLAKNRLQKLQIKRIKFLKETKVPYEGI
ncbi:MAG: 50S ribosomal protein L13 [Candidatus Berkelbacteria bacterium]|nr:50S ribosomal protein L13 [Candidatus Berkelbacteria bacterium]